MRLNHKMIALTALLAVGMAMTACGGSASGSTASSAASSTSASSVALSSAAEEQTGAVQPIAQGTLEEMKSDSYKLAADLTAVKDGQLTMTVYSYDAYEKADIDSLKEGDVIQTHDQGDTTVTEITVSSIERDTENGYVTINGGVEEGGLELCTDHDVYRTLTFDDYPVYYKVGELTLPLADDVSVSDTSADPQAVAVITEGKAAVEEMLNETLDNWTCLNTTVFTENGQVSGINRIWVP